MKIAAVSYLNTAPFIYGIEHAAQELRAGLLLLPPSGCARAFAVEGADVALVPVGALSDMEEYDIVTDFCIGASGPVRTVVLLTDEPLDGVRRVFLDPHSRTSASLVRILCRHRWGITPEFCDLEDYSALHGVERGDAFMLIGDKVFDHENRFTHTFDLAAEWHAMTGLPFVFAVWVARQKVPPSAVESLRAALEYGVDHVGEAVEFYGHGDKTYAYSYLTENIDYRFDEKKQQALKMFQDLRSHDHIIPEAT